MGRYSQRLGAAGEDAAALQLQMLGLEMVRVSSNKWRVVGWVQKPNSRGVGLAKVVPEPRQTQETDRRAIEPRTGRSVFAEVKVRSDKLSWSDLAEHQRATLTRHNDCGGISLVVWIEGSDVHVLRWPIPGFRPYHPLTPEDARRLAWRPSQEVSGN